MTDPEEYWTEVAKELGRKFICRQDAKAVQLDDGSYRKDVDVTYGPPPGNERIETLRKFTMTDLRNHLAGTATYGHYLIGTGNVAKVFCFDCDLERAGRWIQLPDLHDLPEGTSAETDDWLMRNSLVHTSTPRADWLDPAHPGREWYTRQMTQLAGMLAWRIRNELGIPALVTYTGSKGVHVYGMLGRPTPAAEAREAAMLVLATLPRFQPVKGKNFYGDTSDDWYDNFSNFTIEVYPKQDGVNPDGFGNLLRLPLGVNKKNPGQMTFIIDENRPDNVLVPHMDPLAALRNESIYRP